MMYFTALKSLTRHCIYCKYFLVGAVVGITAILVREVIAFLLPADTPFFYGLSVVLVCIGGIVAAYIGHLKVTFSHVDCPLHAFIPTLNFTLIAILGLVTTTLLSLALRYILPLELVVGEFKPTVAFALATIIASFITYPLNARFTFTGSERGSLSGPD